jgi:dTMP kinase
MKPLFVTFEGGEGSGKSTLIKHISSWLTEHGLPHLVTREPGGTPFGEKVRDTVLDAGCDKISAKTELLLFLAARLEHVEKVIAPHLEQGCVVLCDRFIDSTVAYQGYGRGEDPARVWALSLEVVPLLPHITFYLDVPIEVGFKRVAHRHQGIDRLEREAFSFHERVREGFFHLARSCPSRISVLDATRAKDSVQADAEKILAKKLGLPYAS